MAERLMAGRAGWTWWAAQPGRRRGTVLVALLALVLVVHGCVATRLFEQMADRDAARAMPARMEVAYVRSMDLSAPSPAAAPAPAQGAARRVRAARPAAPAHTASAAPPAPAAEVVSVALAEPTELAQVPVQVQPPVGSAAEPDDDDMGESLALPRERVRMPVPVPVPAAAASAASAVATFEWPLSTRISYRLSGNYRGEVSGTAQVEWIRAGDHYQVHLDLVVGASFAPLITRRMSSDGAISAAGLVPHRYDQDTKVMFRERQRVTLQFEPDAVVLANGERSPTLRGVQDAASQFVQLTYVFSTHPELLRVGGVVEIPLALPHKVDLWTYDVVGEDALDTPFGALASVHLKPRRTAPKPGELSAEIWFAPQLRYLPVRIRIQQDEQTYIDLMIEKRPELGS